MQILAVPEPNVVFLGDIYLFAIARIEACTGIALLYAEDTKVAEFDPIPVRQRIGHPLIYGYPRCQAVSWPLCEKRVIGCGHL